MRFIVGLNIILAAILLGVAINWLYMKMMAKRSATEIDQDEFKEKMRKAQIIDVREKDAFDAGHIMGARNISYSTFKQLHGSLRHDLPIFLYDQRKSLSVRAANILRKNGYTNVYILKGGYNDWTGKVKRRK
ncbi:rhodanese-like domain-containing protein [Vagococcus sp. PNs007]|uniref:Rhodanese-like domain-containing protein n=1 Tax=Vagococcus proximus TaxID=2991417 RepID=A0ABT5X3B8_9ENTE|nr:rhodanese-like domain-containing protein [Vagococcus proximus]